MLGRLHHIPMWTFAEYFGDPSGIRTHDLHLERVTSKAARRWGRRLPLTVHARAYNNEVYNITAQINLQVQFG